MIPSLHGLSAGVLITTLSYFPFMYLPVAATLRRLDPAVEESARTLGSDSVGVFFRVVLPQLRLAILGGGLLIGVHLLAEFGAFAMIRFDTFTVAIFQQFQVTFDGAAGSMLAGVLVLLCLALLIAEAAARGKIRFARIGSGAPRAATPNRLGHSTIPALVALTALAVLSLGVPVWTLAALAVDRWRRRVGLRRPRQLARPDHRPGRYGRDHHDGAGLPCRMGRGAVQRPVWPAPSRAPTMSPVRCPASSPRSRSSLSPSTTPDRCTRACR